MANTHRTYDDDFRREAVELLLSSGRPLTRVADELGAYQRTSKFDPLTVVES